MEVIQGEKRREKGYGGLYNVGKAATKNPPALMVLTKRFQSEHDNAVESAETEAEAVTLVGKGVVHDTRGLSLKISGGMVGMKTDCERAAGLLVINCKTTEQRAVYCPKFTNAEFTSEVADSKNSVSDRMNAQASCAAQFVGNNVSQKFYEGEGKWLHVDMAEPAVGSDGRGTGYGFALGVECAQMQWV